MTGFGRLRRPRTAGPYGRGSLRQPSPSRHRASLPRALRAFEMDARRMIQSRLERAGSTWPCRLGPAPTVRQQVAVDATLAAQYVAQARELGRARGLAPTCRSRGCSSVRASCACREAETPAAGSRGRSRGRARRRSTSSWRAARPRASPWRRVPRLHAALRAQVDVVAARTPGGAGRYQERLRERIRRAPRRGRRRRGALMTEVAIWADKTDVREEMTPAARAPRPAPRAPRQGRPGRPGAGLPDPGAESRGQHDRIEGRRLELSQAALAAKGIIEKMPGAGAEP